MRNLAFSLGTLGSGADAVIVEISAMAFDAMSARTGEIFHRAVDIDSCLQLDLHVDGISIRHWAENQEPDGRIPVPLTQAMLDLKREFNWPDLIVWSDMSSMHPSILDTAARRIHSPVPWCYYNLRDIHTQLDGKFIPTGDSISNVKNIARAIQDLRRPFEHAIKQA